MQNICARQERYTRDEPSAYISKYAVSHHELRKKGHQPATHAPDTTTIAQSRIYKTTRDSLLPSSIRNQEIKYLYTLRKEKLSYHRSFVCARRLRRRREREKRISRAARRVVAEAAGKLQALARAKTSARAILLRGRRRYADVPLVIPISISNASFCTYKHAVLNIYTISRGKIYE